LVGVVQKKNDALTMHTTHDAHCSEVERASICEKIDNFILGFSDLSLVLQ